jgi:dTDP-4-dehydrorhamnose 3,5-epimerase
VTETSLPGVLVLEPKIWRDDRGFFLESFNERVMAEAGIRERFVQDNHSRSRKNVLRGIHYQLDKPQGKLVRVIQGEVFDVAVDIRKSSPTFGRWTSTKLDGDSLQMFWIPPGFAHAFLVLSESADFLYKTTEFYSPQHERTIVFNDPDIGIEWPIAESSIVLSEKDRNGRLLCDAEVFA